MEYIDVYAIPGIREPVSCLSHLLAVPVFAVLGYLLIRRGRGNWGRTASLSVLAFSTVFLLSASAAYHLLEPGIGRVVMRQLDVAGVFALIAGTATPIHAILFRGFNRWAPLFLIWSAAAIGITLRSAFPHVLSPFFADGIFVALGWGGLFSCVLLWRRYGFTFVSPLVWGGVSYTVGVVVLDLIPPVLLPGIVGAHELWHLAVIIGLGLHWKFVFGFATGRPDLAS